MSQITGRSSARRSERLALVSDSTLRRLLALKRVDLGLDGGDSLGRGEHLQGRLGHVTAVDRQGHDPVVGLLERPGVGIVRARLEAGHVAVAQSAGVFPERERRKLVVAESQDHPLVAGLVAEHGEGAPLARPSPACSSW